MRTTVLLFILTCLGHASLQAQTGDASIVKWLPIVSPKKELVVFMPEGFVTVNDARTSSIWSRGSISGKSVEVARSINGTVLQLSYAEGKGEKLFEFLAKREPFQEISRRETRNFNVIRLRSARKNQFIHRQCFITERAIYVLTTHSRFENNPIVDAFFSSVRILDGKIHIAPNLSDDKTDSTKLPGIRELSSSDANSAAIDEGDADRPAIILFQPVLKSTSERGNLPQTGSISGTVVLSRSGSVTDVKVSGNASAELIQGFAEALKKIVFIPAEKDGKSVSVTRKFRWEMNITVRTETRVVSYPEVIVF